MKLKLLAITLILLSTTLILPAQGLKFNGQEMIIHERTSLDVFGDLGAKFKGKMEISFEFDTSPVARFGYVFRIADKRNPSEVWNLSFDSRSDKTIIMLNEEGKRSIIKAEFEDRDAFNFKWTPFSISFDARKDSITLSIGDMTYSAASKLNWNQISPNLYFGLSGHVVDVPSFAIRNLSVSDARHSVDFPLNECEGNKLHDSRGYVRGSVTNPHWMTADASHWEHCCTLSSETPGGVFYDEGKSELCLFNCNSVQRYRLKYGNVTTVKTDGECPSNLLLGTNFLKGRTLYSYEANDWIQGQRGCSISSLDLNSLKWTAVSESRLDGPMHHHSSFIRKDNGAFVLFGGFGNMVYNGDFITLDSMFNWKHIWKGNGDTLHPRFFSASGMDETGDYVYIFGGMGNESGDQVVGRKYYYDLHKLDTRTGECRRLWSIVPKEEDFVPARNLIVDGDCFYVLCYPEYLTDSVMHLYKFNIKDGSYEIMANGIDVVSDKIWCYSSLFLDRELDRFVVAAVDVDNELKPNAEVYTLLYPPLSESGNGPSVPEPAFIIIAILLAATIPMLILVGRYNEKKRQAESYSQALADPKKRIYRADDRNSAVCLFGNFMVRDRDGNDISEKFSNQQRSLLFLLLKYRRTGLSSVRLSNLMWPDKEESKVKNSRGVAMNSLRKSLSLLDGFNIVFEDGAYNLKIEEPGYCDLVALSELRDHPDRTDEMLRILSKGRFLTESSDPMFDSFKEDVGNIVTPILSDAIQNCFSQRKYHATIEIADMMFGYDPLDETALHYLIQALLAIHRRDDAMVRYAAFVSEYQKINDDLYHVKFDKV